MYKSKLQELCQKRQWRLPTYTSAKQGLDHNPSFSATVIVNGQSFRTATSAKSSKEAQNDAAGIALHHFSQTDSLDTLPIPSASSFPQPSLPSSMGCLGAITDVETISGLGQTFQQTSQGTYNQTPQADYNTSSVNPQTIGSTTAFSGNKFRDVQHLYKNHLQMYVQKKNLPLPSYSCERQGPPHASRFKCRVTVDGKIFESSEYFPTLKEAEHAAAQVALASLSSDVVQQDDSAFYKNLLQELIQKEGFCLPTYSTERFGESHCPVFVSTVEIEGKHFTGEREKTKKLAEISAAKAAYDALRESKSSQSLPILSSSQKVHEAQNVLSPCTKSNVSVNVTTVAPMNSSYSTIPMQAKDQTGQSSITIFYVYIPICIPWEARHEIGVFLKKVSRAVSGDFYMVNNNGIFSNVNNQIDQQQQQAMELGLGREFHISLGRTVSINNQLSQVHSILPMLRHNLLRLHQTRYWIDFSKWEVFVNDERTRTFLSLEVTSTGLAEIKKQIEAVNEVYKLLGLPEYYKDPHPHISLAWTMGDHSNFLKKVIKKEWRSVNKASPQKPIFTTTFNCIACRIGNKTYQICKYAADM